MVRKHLGKKHVILEEDLLEKIADSTDKSETLSSVYTFVVVDILAGFFSRGGGKGEIALPP